MMKIVEIVKLGKQGRELDLSDVHAIRLTGNISASGKTLFLQPVMFDAVLRLGLSAVTKALH